MEFKIKPRTEVKILVDDKEFLIKKPTEGQIEDLLERLEVDGKKSAKVLREFIESLGIPGDIVRNRMEFEHIEDLVDFLLPKKKSYPGRDSGQPS